VVVRVVVNMGFGRVIKQKSSSLVSLQKRKKKIQNKEVQSSKRDKGRGICNPVASGRKPCLSPY
jgi:hypothetical protein